MSSGSSHLDDPVVSNLTVDGEDGEDDDDDDSYVPESLRNFLNEADKKLDSDLADLLEPIRKDEKSSVKRDSEIPDVTDPNFEYNEEDDEEDNTIFMNILQQETDDSMKKELMGALTTQQKEDINIKHVQSPPVIAGQEQQQQQQQRPIQKAELDLQLELQHELPLQLSPAPSEAKAAVTPTPKSDAKQTPQQALPSSSQPQQDPTPVTDKKDTDDALLDIINPSAPISDSHIKRVAMQGASAAGQKDEKKSKNNKKKQMHATTNSGSSSGKASSKKKNSPSPLKQVERKLQKELDREAKRASLGTPPASSMSLGLRKRNNRVAPAPDVQASTMTTTASRSTPSPSPAKTFKATPTPPRSQVSQSSRIPSPARRSTPSKPVPESSNGKSRPATTSSQKNKQPPMLSSSTSKVASPALSFRQRLKEPSPKNIASKSSPQVVEQVFAVQGPTSAHHAANEESNGSERSRRTPQEIQDSVFARQGPSPARRQPLPTSASPKLFKAKPAPVPPKPKEISFDVGNDTSGEPVSNRSVSPLQGGANHSPQTIETNRSGKPSAMSPMLPSPLKPRLLDPTAGTHNGDVGSKLEPVNDGGRRPLTRPDSNVDRLVKPTSTSLAHAKKTISAANGIGLKSGTKAIGSTGHKSLSSQPLSSDNRLLRETKAVSARSKKETTVVKAETRRGVTKKWSEEQRAQVKARVEALQARTKGATGARAKPETQAAAPQGLARSRDPKERLKQMEQERLAKLKAKMMAKDRRLQSNMSKLKRNQRVQDRKKPDPAHDRKKPDPVPASRNAGKRRPKSTIPVAPNFATDRRIQKKDPPEMRSKEDEPLPLAASVMLLQRGLRAQTPAPPRPTKRTLTVAEAPNFATTQRYGDKLSSPQKGKKKGTFSDDSSWYSTLRDGTSSPASKAASSVKSGPLTIPQTPNFQPVRKRPLPKSTAEKEREEMEYYKNHPFRANSVKMNPLPPSSLRNKVLSSAKPKQLNLTTPLPFNLRTDRRATQSHFRHETAREKGSSRFKARPMPDFSVNDHVVPMTDHAGPGGRQMTTPEPFHFHTTSRGAAYTPEVAQASKKPSGKRGLGRPSGASGLVFQRKSHVEPEIKPFKAKPMPKFIPKTIQVAATKTASEDSTEIHHARFCPEPETKPFKAKPMPNFETPAIPVQQRDPNKTRTPPSQRLEEITSPGFHAKPVPKSLMKEPDIAVKERNPRKLRSPDTVKRPSPPRSKQDVRTFHAQPVPQAITQEPSIPVRNRDPRRLRSPDASIVTKARSPPKEVSKTPTTFHALPIPSSIAQPAIPVRNRDPTKLRSSPPEKRDDSPPMVIATPSSSSNFHARAVPSSLSKPSMPVRQRNPTKLRSSPKSAENSSTPNREDRLNMSSESSGLEREQAKTRLKQRLALRKAAKKLGANGQPESPAMMTSPKAFSSSNVRERLSRGPANAKTKKADNRAQRKETTPAKTPRQTEVSDTLLGDVPNTISLPLSNRTKKKKTPVLHTPTKEAQTSVDASMKTPLAGNAKGRYPDSPSGDADLASDAASADIRKKSPAERDAELQREAALACALTEPDADESDSIRALAEKVKRMAEDELSFHGSLHSSLDPRGNHGF
ncbi:MAG: hypothetical protein SGILL_004989 [Bacillariaceae sp.]